MEVSRRRPPPPPQQQKQQQQRSIRLWDLGWGLWGAFRFVLGSLLAGALRRGRLSQEEEAALSNGAPPSPALTSSPDKLKSAPSSRRLSKASEVCGGGSSWIITWVVVLASPRLWVRAGAGFAWLLVARWTSLISLALRWTSSLVAALKEADAKSSR